MANKNIKKYAKDFTSETGKLAGSLPKTPRIKTIITKALTHKTELTPKEKKKLEKFFGKKFETDEIDHELMIAAGLIKRAYFDDSSLKLLYDLKGEKIVGENTTLTAPVITISFDASPDNARPDKETPDDASPTTNKQETTTES